jgi:hypothetical protein
MVDLERLRELAKRAIPGSKPDGGLNTGNWVAWFSRHGDPYVNECRDIGRGTVCTVSTGPDDYGRARAEYIAAANPATMQILLDVVEAARTVLHRRAPFCEPSAVADAEFALRSALARLDDTEGDT